MTVRDPERKRLLVAAIEDAARKGLPCPSNEALAGAAGYAARGCVVRILRTLEAEGVLTVKRGSRSRQMTVAASGLTTAGVRDEANQRASAARVGTNYRTDRYLAAEFGGGARRSMPVRRRDPGAPIETVEEYLARGGRITVLEPVYRGDEA